MQYDLCQDYGMEAFMYCGRLTSVTIPSSVETIGGHAFTSCWKLRDVYSYITDLSSVSVEYVFFNVLGSYNYSRRTLHVPQGTTDAYQDDENWYPYFGQIVEDLIPDHLPGDVNRDGEVNIADVNAVIDVILDDGGNTAADVNADGEISIADINAVIDIILTS